MDEETKQLKTDELKCGVVLPNGTLCGDEGFSLVAGDDFLLCFCEAHATGALIQGRDYIVQETTAKEAKRYYGVQFPTIPVQPETESHFDTDRSLPVQPTLPGL